MAQSMRSSTLGSSRAIRAPLLSLVKHMSSISPPTLSLLGSDKVSGRTISSKTS
jgi:hypothetical protein